RTQRCGGHEVLLAAHRCKSRVMTGVHTIADESQRKWRKSKVAHHRETLRPTGPVSPGDFLIVKGEFATIPPATFCLPSYNTERSVCVFKASAESIGPMWSERKPNPGTGTDRLPLVGPQTQVKERVGRTTPFSSSAMSSAPAIP